MNVQLASGVSVAHENPDLLARFYAFASAHPWAHYVISSGDRVHQPATGVGGNVAAEGTSNHQRYAYGRGPDEALDVTEDGHYIGDASDAGELPLFGLHIPVLSDRVHVTRSEVNG